MKKQFIAFSTLLMLAAAMKLQSAEPENSLISKSLSVQSADEKFKLSFGGRIQADGAVFVGEDYQPLGNGVGFRRVRLELPQLLVITFPARWKLTLPMAAFR